MSASQRFRWGIVGTGYIADLFCHDLSKHTDADITACIAIDAKEANDFASKFDIELATSNWDAFLNAPIDIVYIATPHHLHPEHTIKALKAGKHVLCEKPMAVNAKLAQEMIDVACENRCFLMEAVWVAFLPGYLALRKMLEERAVGNIRRIDVQFCFQGKRETQQRLYDPKYGGGSLLDVGLYGLFIVNEILGTEHVDISFNADINEAGVDEAVSIFKRYQKPNQRTQLATINTDITTRTPFEVVISGDKGYIRICSPWFKFKAIDYSQKYGSVEELSFPYEGYGYQFEAIAMMEHLRNHPDALEHPQWPHRNTIRQLSECDEIRKGIGVKYPYDQV